MTNNDRLLIVQNNFKIMASKIAEVCHCRSPQTVYSWRKMAGGQFHRNMTNAAWALLASHIVNEGYCASMEELNQLIDAEYNED